MDGKHAAEFAAKAEEPGFDAQTVTNYTALSRTATNVATVTLTAPAGGFVILTGNGGFSANHTNGTASALRAFLAKTSGSLDYNNLTHQAVPASAPSGNYSAPFSITRVYPVTAGEHTFYMTADAYSGSGHLARHNLTGIFVKNQL